MQHRSDHFRIAALLGLVGLAGCGAAQDDDAPAESSTEAPAVAEPTWTYAPPNPDVSPSAHVVDVVAEDYAFDAPDSILSGWTTFRLHNEGEETHFLLLTRVPDDQTYDDYVSQVSAPINDVWYRMRDEGLGKTAAFEEVGAMIPGWYWTGAETFGGPGMVIPGGVSQVTVDLPPGEYVLECFMKTAEGEFHWSEGMLRPLTVLAERSTASAPESQVRLTLTPEGIQVDGAPQPGTNTVLLDFAQQPEAGFGNDVHVVHLEEGMTPEDLVSWMDAFNLQGLTHPAPAPFVGGSHERPEGNILYFTVELLPGRYAFMSEGAEETGGIFTEFTVR